MSRSSFALWIIAAFALCFHPCMLWGQTLTGGTIRDALSPGPLGPQIKSSKIGADLLTLQREYAQFIQSASPSRFQPSNLFLNIEDERVAIDVVGSGPMDDLVAALRGLDMDRIVTFGSVVSGRLRISNLSRLDGLQRLRFARPAYAMRNVGITTSQGDVAMRSDFARALFGLDASGVTIGTLSDSYDCLGGAATDVATGDLPPGVIVLAESCPGSDEGRAMMQLIADVAPKASQAFHTASGGQATFAQGIVDLAMLAGAKVIVDDIIYLAEPMFQDGIIAQAVDAVNLLGVPYFSSAGNTDRQSYESSFRSSGIIPPGLIFPGIAHDFDPGAGVDIFQKITLPSGITVISFQWASPYVSASGGGGSLNDLDFYIYLDPPGASPVISSVDGNLFGDPIEVIGISNSGPPITVNIAITNFFGPDPLLMKYVYFNGGMSVDQFATSSGTIYGHANAGGAQAVGAAAYFATPEFGVSPPVLEPFSSAGPVPILFDLATPDAPIFDLRLKPNIVCPDGTNTTFFGVDIEPDGFPNFFGTSAAAPHAAGLAALLLDADPSLTPTEVFAALEKSSIDMGPEGFDFDTGFGLCQADAALVECGAFPDVTVPGPATIATQYLLEACNTLHVGDVDVLSPGDVTFRAGTSISFGPHFSVGPGAIINAEIEAALVP